mmetsp:Transcript_65295/g.131321  ORF Transcript_65295/g.131321 Transcript_65295/m.131321 type:complete len:993 (+) Transcript_65295:77-3055(+)
MSLLLATAQDRKNSGNEHFTKGYLEMARIEYTTALDSLEQDSQTTKETSDLMATLYTNRAAAHLGLKDFDSALADCNSALQLDPTKEKAMFRRSQANEGLGKASEALKDLMELVRQNPKNRSAISAARRCKEQVERESAVDRSPLAAAFKALREDGKDRGRITHALKVVINLTHDDEVAANFGVRLGGCGLLWALRTSPSSEEVELALRALAAMCEHASVVNVLNEKTPSGAPAVVVWEDLLALIETNEAPRAQCATALALKLRTRGPHDTEVELRSVERAVQAWAAAVAHQDWDVRSAGLDAAVQWCSEATPASGVAVSAGKEAQQASVADRRAAAESERHWKEVLKRRAVALCKSPANAAMFALLDSDIFLERQKSLAAFGRVFGTVGEEEMLKELLEPLVAKNASDGHRDLSLMRRKVALTSALLLANGDLGVWLLGREGAIRECLALIASGDDLGQSLAAEALCLAASTESGRSLLAPVVEAGTLDALLDCPNARARSAAASTLAKLGVASKALSSDSPDTGRLLNTAMLLLKGTEESQALESGSTPSAEQQRFAESASVTTERAVEVLAALITKSAVKDELSHGSGRCAQALTRLCSISKDGKGAAAYGLAHIFASLSVTNKEVQERMLAEKEMEITPEQLSELQRITKQKAENEEEDTDDAERCGWRIRQIVQADGIRALVRLSDGASEATKDQVSLALRQISVEPSVRGSLVQQGAYKCCLNFASSATSSPKCVRDAVWCIAKTLVSTNPGMLTASQRMGCIACLLQLCKDHKASDLTHFEALMGLTNVASYSEETKARIAAEKGVRTLEYMQFSDHELVRRAATECMTNLMPHKCMVEHLRSEDKLKLWCAFAEDFEADMPTARAAAGTLAMAAGIADEELHQAVLQSRAFEVWVTLLKSGSPELAHRAAVAIGYILHTPEGVSRIVGVGAKVTLTKLAKKKNPEWADAANAAASALKSLAQERAATSPPFAALADGAASEPGN